jgi:hypothetical protein
MEESRRINAAKDFARSAFHGEVFVKHGRHGIPFVSSPFDEFSFIHPYLSLSVGTYLLNR